MDGKSVVLLTHVKHFVGPGAVRRLLLEEMTVVCHDAAFADRQARAAFRAETPARRRLSASIRPKSSLKRWSASAVSTR